MKWIITILLMMPLSLYGQKCDHKYNCFIYTTPKTTVCCICKKEPNTPEKYYWMSVKYDLGSETHYENFTSMTHPFAAMDRVEEIVRTKNIVLLNWKEISEYEYNILNYKVFNK